MSARRLHESGLGHDVEASTPKQLWGQQTLLAVCGVTFALMLGACIGPASSERASPSPTTTTQTLPQSESTTTVAAPTSSSVAASSEPVTAIAELTLTDYAIAPTQVALEGNMVSISVTNLDDAPHDVALIATDLEAGSLPTAGLHLDADHPTVTVVARTEVLDPGGSDDFVVAVEPGSYVLVCTVPHHYVRDQMVATLTVSAP